MKQGVETLNPDQINEIARELKVKPEEVMEMEYRLNGQEISLDAHLDEDGDESYSPIAFLEANTPEPSEFLANQQTEQLQSIGLSKALESLDNRSRRVLEARWLNENASSTLHDLADEFGVSAERIRQIEQKAMQKIKLHLSA